MKEMVWLREENRRAVLINLGTVFSTVAYTDRGVEYEVLVENDEFDFIGEDDEDDAEPGD